jgi:hypothetical protein
MRWMNFSRDAVGGEVHFLDARGPYTKSHTLILNRAVVRFCASLLLLLFDFKRSRCQHQTT